MLKGETGVRSMSGSQLQEITEVSAQSASGGDCELQKRGKEWRPKQRIAGRSVHLFRVQEVKCGLSEDGSPGRGFSPGDQESSTNKAHEQT